MAKTKYVNSTQLQKELFKRTEGYAANVRAIYQNYLLQIINLVKGTELEEGKPYHLCKYPHGRCSDCRIHSDNTPKQKQSYAYTDL